MHYDALHMVLELRIHHGDCIARRDGQIGITDSLSLARADGDVLILSQVIIIIKATGCGVVTVGANAYDKP